MVTSKAPEQAQPLQQSQKPQQAQSTTITKTPSESIELGVNQEAVKGEKPLSAHAQLKKLCAESDGTKKLSDIEDLVVSLFNESHAMVKQGAKTLVYETFTDSKGEKRHEFTPVPQVNEFYCNLAYLYKSGKSIKEARLFDLWRKSIERRDYYGVVFDPSETTSSEYLNLWEGFKVEPKKGASIERILTHLLEVVCNGNLENCEYLISWMAQIVQEPHKKMGVMVALRSEERGTGKSTVSRLMNEILGNHAITIKDSKHLTGSFNSHLANKIFVTIEEAFWSGDPKEAGKLRTMVTDSTMTVEGKGKDAFEVDSHHRFLMCTNNEWTVPAHKDERRFFVLDVSPKMVGNKQYFTDLYDEIDNTDSISAFFDYLLEWDINVDLRKAPKTDALQNQIKAGFKPHEKWLDGVLDEGIICAPAREHDLTNSSHIAQIPKSDIYAAYITYCKDMSISGYARLDSRVFGKYISDILKPVSSRPNVNGKRTTCCAFKDLETLRGYFNEFYDYK